MGLFPSQRPKPNSLGKKRKPFFGVEKGWFGKGRWEKPKCETLISVKRVTKEPLGKKEGTRVFLVFFGPEKRETVLYRVPPVVKKKGSLTGKNGWAFGPGAKRVNQKTGQNFTGLNSKTGFNSRLVRPGTPRFWFGGGWGNKVKTQEKGKTKKGFSAPAPGNRENLGGTNISSEKLLKVLVYPPALGLNQTNFFRGKLWSEKIPTPCPPLKPEKKLWGVLTPFGFCAKNWKVFP